MFCGLVRYTSTNVATHTWLFVNLEVSKITKNIGEIAEIKKGILHQENVFVRTTILQNKNK